MFPNPSDAPFARPNGASPSPAGMDACFGGLGRGPVRAGTFGGRTRPFVGRILHR
jgi:hypothetical protein